MSAEACPFCGRSLAPVMSGAKDRVTGYHHPRDSAQDPEACFYSGHFIGAALIGRWNKRAHKLPALGMEVIDEHPVFNTEGRGRPVDISMVNATVFYYRRKANENHQG